METTHVMNFATDKKNKTINVEREFAAPLDRVWQAWTTNQMLDKWWAPKPYQCKTKKFEFKEGGTWLYRMHGPDGTDQWSKFDFKSIKDKKQFSGQDAFCDENGKVNSDFPQATWTNSFSKKDDDATTVNIKIEFKSEADLDKLLKTGFQEGFRMGMENLDELLERDF